MDGIELVAEKKKKQQPRTKGGTFGTSEAKKRRIEQGIEPQTSQDHAKRVPGINAAIAAESPLMPVRMRQEAAQAVATITATSKALTANLIDKINQGLKKTEGLRELINAVPDTARYLTALVRGEFEAAPHSDRLRAAQMILEYTGINVTAALDERDMGELSLDELNQRVMAMEHRIDVATSIPGESHEVGIAAPLRPETPTITQCNPDAHRQAID